MEDSGRQIYNPRLGSNIRIWLPHSSMYRSKPCKYILNKENCPFGKRCRFLHQFRRGQEGSEPLQRKVNRGEDSQDVPPPRTHNDEGSSNQHKEVLPDKQSQDDTGTSHAERNVPVCRFFVQNSRCKFGDKCRYLHPQGQCTLAGTGGHISPLDAKKSSPKHSGLRGDSTQHTAEETQKANSKSPLPKRTSTQEAKKSSRARRKDSDRNNANDTQSNHSRVSALKQSSPLETKKPRHYSHERTDSGQNSAKETRNTSSQGHSQDRAPSLDTAKSSSRYSQAQVKAESVRNTGKVTQSASSRNPPPLTLASFIGGRTHVQRPHKVNQGQKDGSLREVTAYLLL